MATETKQNPKRCITPIGRLSYPVLFKPEGFDADDPDKKYSCELIFPEGTDLSALKAAAKAAVEEKWPDPKTRPKNLRSPFRNGADREGKTGYEGSIFIGARSKDKPQVVFGKDRIPCEDQSKVYGGVYACISVTAFTYEHKGNKGVSFSLNHVWVTKLGESFGGRHDAETEFEDVEIDEDAFGMGDDQFDDDGGDLFGYDGDVPF